MNKFFTNQQDNITAVTCALIKALSVRFTSKTIEEKLNNHPDFPSLYAVSDVLDSLKISNVAIQITPKELTDIPTPCIAHLRTEGGIFALINNIKGEYIHWWHSEKGLQQETISSFSKKWRGVLLIVETSEESGEKNYMMNKKLEVASETRRKLFSFSIIMVIGLVFYLLFCSVKLSAYLLAILIVKLVGIFVSILLLWYLIDKSNPFLKNICTIGESSDCESILDSKMATIGGVLSWSEIGFFYFCGSFLSLLLGHSNHVILFLLFFINLLALPYTIFSVYYQIFVAKKICTLCLSVQVLLWAEFLFSSLGIGYSMPKYIEGYDIALAFLCFMLPIIIWFSLKPLLKRVIKIPFLEKSLNRFQSNASIFNYLLFKEHSMPVLPSEMPIVEIGKPNAPNIITILTSPYCGPCFNAHTLINEILDGNEDTVKCQFVFWASNQESDKRGIWVRHLFSLNKLNQEEALKAWFSKKYDFEEWKKSYPVSQMTKKTFNIVEQHEKWCRQSGTQVTPTIFVNSHLLPNLYNLTDVKRIAPYLWKSEKYTYVE